METLKTIFLSPENFCFAMYLMIFVGLPAIYFIIGVVLLIRDNWERKQCEKRRKEHGNNYF